MVFLKLHTTALIEFLLHIDGLFKLAQFQTKLHLLLLQLSIRFIGVWLVVNSFDLPDIIHHKTVIFVVRRDIGIRRMV
jgi:hypothetical protein